MKNNNFNFEKEIKKFETQLTKLNKDISEKLSDEFYNDLKSLISGKTKEAKNKARLDKIDSQKKSSSAEKLLTNDIIKKLLPGLRRAR